MTTPSRRSGVVYAAVKHVLDRDYIAEWNLIPYKLDSLIPFLAVSDCSLFILFLSKIRTLHLLSVCINQKCLRSSLSTCRRTRTRDHSIPSQTLEQSLAQPNVIMKN